MSGSSLNPLHRQVSMDQSERNFLGTPSKWEIVFIKYPRAVSGQCRENSRNREKCNAATRATYSRRIYRCQASLWQAKIIRAVPVPSFGSLIHAACPHIAYLGILNYSYLGQKRTYFKFFSIFIFPGNNFEYSRIYFYLIDYSFSFKFIRFIVLKAFTRNYERKKYSSYAYGPQFMFIVL